MPYPFQRPGVPAVPALPPEPAPPKTAPTEPGAAEPVLPEATPDTQPNEIPVEKVAQFENSEEKKLHLSHDISSTHTSSAHASPTVETKHTSPSSQIVAPVFIGTVGRAKAQQRRLAKRDVAFANIVEHVRMHGSVTNDGIEKLLDISDATASRYARLLVSQGKLLKHGKGRRVSYTCAQ